MPNTILILLFTFLILLLTLLYITNTRYGYAKKRAPTDVQSKTSKSRHPIASHPLNLINGTQAYSRIIVRLSVLLNLANRTNTQQAYSQKTFRLSGHLSLTNRITASANTDTTVSIAQSLPCGGFRQVCNHAIGSVPLMLNNGTPQQGMQVLGEVYSIKSNLISDNYLSLYTNPARLLNQAYEFPLYKITAPTHAVHAAQKLLFTLFEKEDWAAGLNLLRKLERSLSLLSVKRVLMRLETSREKDELPVFNILARHKTDNPAYVALAEKITRLTDQSSRVGSELLIDVNKIDFPHDSKLKAWLTYDKSPQAFIEEPTTDRVTALKNQALEYVILVIHEIFKPFDQDSALTRGSVTVLGEPGLKLQSLFDLVGIYEYELASSKSIDTIPLPALGRNVGANVINYLASYIAENQPLQDQNIFYNRTGASSHYKGCQHSQFGIDVAPGKLPFNKHHILYGRTYKGDFWFKLEEHGLADASSFINHGRDFAYSKIFPVAKEPDYSVR